MARSASTDWEKGYAPWDAIRKFAPADLWNEYTPLQAKYFSTFPADLIQATPIDYKPKPIQDPLRDVTRCMELLEELKAWILTRLKSGDFEAIAYPKVRTRNSKPLRLTSDYWNSGQYSWDENELWTGDFKFNEIRILPTAINGLRRKEKIGKGRPSFQLKIVSAWESLQKAGKVSKCSELNKLFREIRKSIEAENPEIQLKAEEPSDSALYKVLSPFWRSELARRRNN